MRDTATELYDYNVNSLAAYMVTYVSFHPPLCPCTTRYRNS